MSQENVELARRLYANTPAVVQAAARGEPTAVPEYWDLWDADAVVVEVAEFPDAATYRGLDQIQQRWLQGFADIFDDISIEPQDFVPVGDFVLVPTHQRFRSKAGIDVEQEITQVLQFRNGRLIYATGYRDKSNALKAVGLEE